MLSIIIITRNEEAFLPQLLRSIKAQNYKGEYEIIISDNESSDKTLEIAKEFRCRIVKGGLPSKGRNAGAQVANGNLLLFLDADTLMPQFFLQKSVAEIERRRIDLAVVPFTPMPRQKIYLPFFGFYNYFLKISQYLAPVAGGIMFCTKQLFEMLGGFDEDIIYMEDLDIAHRASKFGKVRILNSPSIAVSTRRFDREGKFKTAFKTIYLVFYKLFYGKLTRIPVNYDMQGINLKTVKRFKKKSRKTHNNI